MPKHEWYTRDDCYEVRDVEIDLSVCICAEAAMAALITKLLNETDYVIFGEARAATLSHGD